MNDEQAFDQGMDDVKYDAVTAEARADAKQWLKAITEAREFDDSARKRYAIDRKYARGDRGQFEVGLPIAGSYIDILKSFLYARDPDLDVQPSDGTSPPPMSDLIRAAKEKLEANPATRDIITQAVDEARKGALQAQVQGAAQAISGQQPQGVPMDSEAVAMEAAQAKFDELCRAKAEQLMEPYRERSREAKQFSQTLEAVVARVWKQASLKAQAEFVVASGLTVAVGWLKASWQERTEDDPIMRGQINDLQDNLAHLEASIKELDEGEAEDEEAQRASIAQQIAGLEGTVEVVVARGLAMDFVPAEDIQVSPDAPNVASYLSASWIAHRTFMQIADAEAAFPEACERLKNASIYYQTKPTDSTESRDIGSVANVDAKDADSFRRGAGDTSQKGNVCVWEVWNRSSNTVLTLVEGMEGYANEPYQPDPGTSRFYPFFLYAPVKVDGERHPQSMIERTQSLLDDMNRIYSNRAEHRRRCIPKMGFDSTAYEPAEIKRLESGAVCEMVGLKPIRPGDPIGNVIVPIKYPMIDQALYDDSPTRAMLEMAWGIQEALTSTIRTAKTATEAEIQQHGTQARTGYMRDCLDNMLDELAQYTAEVCMQQMNFEDVKRIAGPWAFWPEGLGIEDIGTLVEVSIRAGSSGKPDTVRQREAWSVAMPVLQNAIVQVGQLRGSSPESVADAVEELVAETLKRTGDKIDPDRFLPKEPDTRPPMQAQQPQPMQPQGAPQ